MAVLGLRFCARAFSTCGERGPLFIAVRWPLTVAASLVAEHRLQTCRLSNCGSRAQLLRGMWDLPRPGLEPESPALAGRFSTTAPPGKPLYFRRGNVLEHFLQATSFHHLVLLFSLQHQIVCTIDTVYKIDNSWEPTVEHRELYSMLHGDPSEKEIQKRGEICICIADSFCCTVETNTIL